MFQFTPVLRRATSATTSRSGASSVSIHARLATGDDEREQANLSARRFNSRPSCDGRHFGLDVINAYEVSIHARLATGDLVLPVRRKRRIRFNSRPSCDGRQRLQQEGEGGVRVSIHARLATGDKSSSSAHRIMRLFQFTPVLRRATRHSRAHRPPRRFNSRPSCDGRLPLLFLLQLFLRFNSRPSCDGRPLCGRQAPPCRGFNSRPSCDGRLCNPYTSIRSTPVSIHARLATGDPRSNTVFDCRDVSIHARLATGDNSRHTRSPIREVSIHARLATGDPVQPTA